MKRGTANDLLQQQPYTVHIVLATIPLNQHDKYLKSIEENFYKEYKKNTGKYYNDKQNKHLYRPIKYYMFGTYDIAFISLIDSFKFAQKLFIPDNVEGDTFNPNSFQIITGMWLRHSGKDCYKNLDGFFEEKLLINPSSKPFFSAIINLKINNGLLIGNGNILLEDTVEAIAAILNLCKKEEESFEYIILQSFSWYEINIICFLEDLNLVSYILKMLRELSITKLSPRNHLLIFKNSLYKLANAKGKNLTKENMKRLFGSIHIFSDTQTYLGLDYSILNAASNDELTLKLKDIKIEAEVEWQAKPGHLGNLLKILEEFDIGIKLAIENDNEPDAFILTGKSDYLIPASRISLLKIIFLFKKLLHPDGRLFNHVRKIKTRVLLPAKPNDSLAIEKKPGYQKIIEKLGISNRKINEINEKLKELKVSRQLRNKVKKIFYNYNNGIQDHVLLPYFLDFYGFISSLQRDIEIGITNINYSFNPRDEVTEKIFMEREISVSIMEKKLRKYIRVFEEGHKIRSLNSYQFEDINDFDLDFNTSIQQLLSIYSSLILEISSLFYPDYFYGPVVQLNWNDTVANIVSVNYNIYHLLSPEFVFSTITKEILNQYKNLKNFKDTKAANPINIEIAEVESDFNKAVQTNSFLLDFHKSEIFDFNNLTIDAIRFIFTFNADFNLFCFWLWTYNFQNSSLYSSSGPMEEGNFKTELFRFIFVAYLFGYESEITEESCPLPEIQTYWSRYWYKTKQAIRHLLINQNILPSFKKLVLVILKDPLRKQIQNNGLMLSNKWISSFEIKDTAHISFYEERLSAVFKNVNDSEAFNLDLLKRNECIQYFDYKFTQVISKGCCVYYNESSFVNPNMYICALIYTYLKIIASLNKNEVRMLRRDWETGLPLKAFIRNEKNTHLYSVDPMGGVFFSTSEKLNAYFVMRNGLLKSLWHFSQIQKYKYISHIINKPLN